MPCICNGGFITDWLQSDPSLVKWLRFARRSHPFRRQRGWTRWPLEHHFLSNGYTLAYVPDAIIWNHGPTSVRDFLRQRRRIHSGHLDFSRKTRYRVATLGVTTIFRAFLQEYGTFPASSRPLLLFAVLLEAWGRALGRFDTMVFRTSHVVWERSATTKECLDELSGT